MEFSLLFLRIVFVFSITISKVFSSPKIELNNYSLEVRAAKNLSLFYEILENNHDQKTFPNLTQIKKIKKSLKKSTLFSSYIYFLDAFYQQHYRIKGYRYLEKCLSFPKRQIQHPLDTIFTKKTTSYCLNHFFQNFKIKSKKTNVRKIHIKLLTKHVDRFLKKDTIDSFSIFLSTIPQEIPLFKRLADKIKYYYRQNSTIPPPSILSVIPLDSQFTHFIQRNRPPPLLDKKHFKKEFEYFIKNLQKINTPKNDQKIQTATDRALLFYNMNKKYLSTPKMWRRLMGKGKRMIRQNRINTAFNFFNISEEILGDNPSSESRFYKFLIFLINNDISGALRYFQREGILDNFDQLSGKFKFWIARTHEYNKEYVKSKQLYLKIIKSHSLSYYAILSLEHLKKLHPHHNYQILANDRKLASSNISLTNATKKNLMSIAYFSKISHSFFISQTLKYLLKQPLEKIYQTQPQNPDRAQQQFTFILLKTLNRHAQYLETFKLTRSLIQKHSLPLSREILKLLFPQKYLNKIKKRKKRLDPLIIMSLIRQESAFNPKARSHAGARGLMQLLPSTAKQYRPRLKTHKLYNPNLNLSIGIKYLENLFEKNQGNLIHTFIAYNAGEGNLSKWKKFILTLKDPILNIELIPFQETQDYVKLIYRNLYFYNLLNNNGDFLQKSAKENFYITIANSQKALD